MTARRSSFIRRLRLRHKLAISLSMAALLPVLVVWWVAGRVVFDNLDRGIRVDTERQLQVGLSLVLHTVQRIGSDAAQLAGSQDLAEALDLPEDAGSARAAISSRASRVRRFIDIMSPHLESSLIQLFDRQGQQIARTVVGHDGERFADVEVSPDSGLVRSGLSSNQQMTIESVGKNGGTLVVRTVAPVLDRSFRLFGVVVVSVPLDRSFAEGVKGALGTDILFFAGIGEAVRPASTTFLDSEGRPAQGIEATQEIAGMVGDGRTAFTIMEILGRHYTVAFTSLNKLDGEPVGMFAVAVDRATLTGAKRVATRSLVLGAVGAVLVALLLASFMSRRLSYSISQLHRGAQAVARGDLEHEIEAAEGDEISDLATAFAHMTQALKENRARLAARMNEIMALHDAARAVSSVIDLDEVLRTIVDSAASVLDVRLGALWLVDARTAAADEQADAPDGDALGLRLGAARVKSNDMSETIQGDESAEVAEPLEGIAREVARSRAGLRIDDIARKKQTRAAALASGVTGSLLGAPLVRAGQVLGVIVVGRTKEVKRFSDADADLLSTFADQASSAVANARLYQEVRAFNEELEANVAERTAELTAANAELEKTLRELRETQSQLISSERLAGLGLLVAGVAHEINSPSAAIAGSADALEGNVARLVDFTHRLSQLGLPEDDRHAVARFVGDVAPTLAAKPLGSGAKIRRAARALRQRLEERGLARDAAKRAAGLLAELSAGDEVIDRFLEITADADAAVSGERVAVIVGYLTENVFLHKNASTIRNAIRRVQRIVGALKSYSRLDQEAQLVEADVHEGLDDTLVILDYALRDIRLVRRYGDVPQIPIYADELNQVWTNLIQNAVQALAGKGQIVIETAVADDGVVVRVIDDGPGIPADAQPKIFEPFFTTKAKGEGTGLGLGIVRQIIDKHQGRVGCESQPGRTCFHVWLPVARPVEVDAPSASEVAS